MDRLMADPLPKVESLEDAFERARVAIAALKQTPVKDRAEARRRSAQIISMQRETAGIARDVAEADAAAVAAARIANSTGAAVVDTELLGELLGELGKTVAQHTKDTVEPLKQRIAELEARPVLEDAGVWQERALYRPGHVVTYKGSAWVCREANSTARPGKSDVWRLMVKSEQR
jgi:hypothetical protein